MKSSAGSDLLKRLSIDIGELGIRFLRVKKRTGDRERHEDRSDIENWEIEINRPPGALKIKIGLEDRGGAERRNGLSRMNERASC